MTSQTPAAIAAFLKVETPASWVESAVDRLPELLVDHANCELKAASTALAFIYRYPDRCDLCQRMSRLAREELRHYEQVRRIMADADIEFRKLSASRYASSLNAELRDGEPLRLMDALLVGAIIEARSCERFAAIAPRLPVPLGRFYSGLLASEARHFENYLALARRESGASEEALQARLGELLETEAELVTAPDEQFRFHSGFPAAA